MIDLDPGLSVAFDVYPGRRPGEYWAQPELRGVGEYAGVRRCVGPELGPYRSESGAERAAVRAYLSGDLDRDVERVLDELGLPIPV